MAQFDEPATQIGTKKRAQLGDDWRGSQLFYRNEISLPTLDRSYDQTYNPYWGNMLYFRARYALSEMFYVQAKFWLAWENTNSDVTTSEREVWPSNLTLTAGADNFYRIPLAKIDLSANFEMILPTSPTAQARTMVLGLKGGLSLARTFTSVAKGLTIGYDLDLTKYLNRYSTAQRESPLIPGCAGTLDGCDQFLNSGVRNSSVSLDNSLSAQLRITKWLSAYTAFTARVDFLYGAAALSSGSPQPLEDQNQRFWLLGDIGLKADVYKPLFLRLGAATVHQFQAPDGSLRAPIFDRNTVFYLDVGVNVADLVSKLGG